MVLRLSLVLVLSFLAACASKPLLEKDDIKVTRDAADPKCQNLGPIEGRTITIKGTQNEAMENLKEEAMKKGANFVQTEVVGAQGKVIRGTAFRCP